MSVNMTENTPDSDVGSIECFQNYTAPEVFVQGLAGTVDQQDVECIIRAQKQMLQRFEKTNEMLANCNTLCVTRLKTASVEFKKHIQLLTEMRKDLDNVFKRIQNIKTKVVAQYPEGLRKNLEELSLSEELTGCEDDEKSPSTPLVEEGPSSSSSKTQPSNGDENRSKEEKRFSSSSESDGNQDSSPNTSDSG